MGRIEKYAEPWKDENPRLVAAYQVKMRPNLNFGSFQGAASECYRDLQSKIQYRSMWKHVFAISNTAMFTCPPDFCSHEPRVIHL